MYYFKGPGSLRMEQALGHSALCHPMCTCLCQARVAVNIKVAAGGCAPPGAARGSNYSASIEPGLQNICDIDFRSQFRTGTLSGPFPLATSAGT